MALVITADDVSSTPPPNYGLDENSKFLTLQTNHSKILSKEKQVFLLLLRKANIGTLGAGTLSTQLEHRTHPKC